jgi:hypothetical protein
LPTYPTPYQWKASYRFKAVKALDGFVICIFFSDELIAAPWADTYEKACEKAGCFIAQHALGTGVHLNLGKEGPSEPLC